MFDLKDTAVFMYKAATDCIYYILLGRGSKCNENYKRRIFK